MSNSQPITSHISLFRAFCASSGSREHAIERGDAGKGRLFPKFQRIAIHSKALVTLTALTFSLTGCSSFPSFMDQKGKKPGGQTMLSHSLSDVETRPTAHNDRVDVTSLSPSAMDKNIAASAQGLLSDQQIIRVEAPQNLKPKSETQASLATHTEPPKPSLPPPPPPAALSRSNLTGKWAVREAGSSGCKVTLSSAPALDLYKASTSGCNGPDIRTVNSWDFRNGEVYLYARGTVVARFRGNGSSLPGSLSKSGAPLVLSR